MKSSGTAYLLWCACCFGLFRIHRFYLGKPKTGLLYLFTGGFFLIGQVIDLFRIPGMVERENMKWQLQHGSTVNINIQGQTVHSITPEQSYRPVQQQIPPQQAQTEIDPEKSLERTILKLARKFKGQLTSLELAANSPLSLEEADKALEDFVKKGYANMTVTDVGNIVFEFPGFLQFDSPSSKELNDYNSRTEEL